MTVPFWTHCPTPLLRASCFALFGFLDSAWNFDTAWVRFALRTAVFEIQVCCKSEKFGNAPHDLRMDTQPSRVPYIPTFWSFSIYDQPFSSYRVIENRKCSEYPQIGFKRLHVKLPYVQWIVTPEPQVCVRFRDTRLSKIGNASNDLSMTLNPQESTVPRVH